MFTGIVEGVGIARGIRKDRRYSAPLLEIEAPRLSKGLKIGGSLAVNGVCLTVVKKTKKGLFFNVVRETMRRTTLGSLRPGQKVNLERPLPWRGRVEGHFVLGHVDGVGVLTGAVRKGRERSFQIRFPKPFRRFLVEKGSIAVDGVSFTLGKIRGNHFWIHCIPHTLKQTHFEDLRPASRVNLEIDLLAKMAIH